MFFFDKLHKSNLPLPLCITYFSFYTCTFYMIELHLVFQLCYTSSVPFLTF